MQVEVAFATPTRQQLVKLEVATGTTVREAVRLSGLAAMFPEHDIEALPKGIWSEICDEDRQLQPGDRVEIYRPLQADPRTARRRRARREPGR